MKTKPVTAADPRDGLLPCPFCGSDAEVDSYDAHAGTFVQCCNCGARVNGGEIEWNSRIAHARPEAVDDLRNKVAIAALQGLLSNPGGPVQANANTGTGFCNCNAEEVAGWALDIANAMIATLTPERAP